MNEKEIIEKLCSENPEFRKISDEHHHLDSLLAEIDRKVYLSPEEEIERKKMQKQKLAKKDQMAEMIRVFKKSLAN
ncbi:MAG: DUF465 domain-containing protein [Thermodesulfovibrionales bacterium]